MLHIKFGFDWPSGFRGEDLRNCGRTTDDGRTPDHGHPISSPCEPDGSGELIKFKQSKIAKHILHSLFILVHFMCIPVKIGQILCSFS